MASVHIVIVIPVYNAGEYLSDCLNSVIAQTYQDWEAICVDDGSTDDSAKILKTYSTKDSRIKIFSKNNGGASSARNYALSKIDSSPSTWISFVDSDDYIGPSMYADIVEALNNANDETIDYIRLKLERTKFRPQEFIGCNIVDQHTNIQLFSRGGYFRNGNVGGMIASLFVKSSIIKANRLSFPTEMRILEDQVFSLRCAMLSRKIMIMDKPCYFYYVNPSSVTETSRNCANDVIRCINYAFDILCNSGEDDIDCYFHKKYMPVKTTLLLSEILRLGHKPDVTIRSDLTLKEYITGAKANLMFFLLKLRRSI